MTSNRSPTRRVHAVDMRRADALQRLGPTLFTTADAHAAGLTRSDLRSDAVLPVTRGIYAPSGWAIDHRTRCAAAIMQAPSGSRIAGLAAARLLGLPVPHQDRIQVAISPHHRTRTRDETTSCHRSRAPSLGTHYIQGVPPLHQLPLTEPHRLLAECLPYLGLVDAVALGDAVTNHLGSEGQQVCGKPGCEGMAVRCCSPRFRSVMRYVRPASESPMETRLRLLLILAGFPEPVMQFEIAVRGHSRRLDLAYPDVKVAIEYDGAHHYSDHRQRQQDHIRLEALRADGWYALTLVARDVFHDPARTLARVAEALRSRHVGVCVTNEWRAYFPEYGRAT